MAYNSGFPIGYQPYYPQAAYQPQFVQNQVAQGQTQQNNSIIWVQGEAGAKSYLVAPNTTVQLWDSEAQVIYLKSADATGMPSIKTLDYTIREIPRQIPETNLNTTFATKEDIDTIEAEIEQIRKEIKGYGKSFVQHDGKRKQPSE